MNKNCVYILLCNDGTYYTGWTNNIDKRLKSHNGKKGAKYTKNRTPVKLVYLKYYDDKSTALQNEYVIKQLSRNKKIELINNSTIELY